MAAEKSTVGLTDEGSGMPFCRGWPYRPGGARFLCASSDFPGRLSFLDS